MDDPQIIGNKEAMKDACKIIQDFVCLLYNVKAVSTVNEARSAIFNKIYKPKSEKEQFKKQSAKLEATAFPPSYQELLQQIKRTIFIAQIWCNAYLKTPTKIHPTNYGWKLVDNKYVFHWFTGEECPKNVSDIVEMDAESDDETDKDTGKKIDFLFNSKLLIIF